MVKNLWVRPGKICVRCGEKRGYICTGKARVAKWCINTQRHTQLRTQHMHSLSTAVAYGVARRDRTRNFLGLPHYVRCLETGGEVVAYRQTLGPTGVRTSTATPQSLVIELPDSETKKHFWFVKCTGSTLNKAGAFFGRMVVGYGGEGLGSCGTSVSPLKMTSLA